MVDQVLATCWGKPVPTFKETEGLLIISILETAGPPSSSAGLVVGPRRRAGWRRGSTQRRGLRWRWQRSSWRWGRRKRAGVGMLGVDQEGGGGRGMKGWKRRQPGSRGRGQLEEVAVVWGTTLVTVGQRVDGCGGMPVDRVAGDGVGPAAGEVYALSLKCRKIFWWVDFPECKGTVHSKINRKLNFKHKIQCCHKAIK